LQPSASELRRDILFPPARVTTGWRVQRAAVALGRTSEKAEGVGTRQGQNWHPVSAGSNRRRIDENDYTRPERDPQR
jgi:hypothetical protein